MKISRPITLILFIALASCAQGQVNSQNLEFHITYSKDQPEKIHISLNFTISENDLHVAPGAEQFDKRWSEFMTNLKARTSDNQPVNIHHSGNGRWKVDAPKGTPVEVSYDLLVTHQEHQWSGGLDGAAYVKPQSIYTSGRSLFLYPEYDEIQADVTFHLPEEWTVSTPWAKSPEGQNRYKVSSAASLSQSGILAGKQLVFSVIRDGFELSFALGSEQLIRDAEVYKSLGKGIFDYYIDLMGGIPNIPGNEDKKCLIILNEDSQTDGEVLGYTISMLINLNDSPMDALLARFIFAHEFFHLWNGKSFTTSSDLEWFKEGFTNYYTLKSLHHTGVLDEETTFGVLNNLFFQRYINDPGLGEIPLTNGDAKHDHWGIIYGGGLFAGIAQDMIIRSATGNASSLDDVMRSLFNELGGTTQALTLEEFKKRLSEASGLDQSSFFEQYIQKANKLPIHEYLEMGGMSVDSSNNQLRINKKTGASAMEKQILKGFFGKK